jgi:predicted glycoside hydrolase/deacetylase ChbG (UPF0249 family)
LNRPLKERALIVNADDFGRSPGINAGIMVAHERGIVTSASLMVRWPAAEEAAVLAKRAPALSLGLHVDLSEWEFRQERWYQVYEVAPTEDEQAVTEEVERQLEAFRRLAGREPTHLDSHQHVHSHEPAVEAVLRRLGDRMGVPVREQNGRIAYRGDFYGQTPEGEPLHHAIGVDGLIETIRGLPAGISELSCHPALGEDFGSPYGQERELEVETLCDHRVRAALESERIDLCSFTEVG